MVKIARLDHLVLTVADIAPTCAFYQQVLGMEPITFSDGRRALRFGDQKINLHQAGQDVRPNSAHAGTGTADLCFITDTKLDAVQAHLTGYDVPLVVGPIPQTGALGLMESVYFRDSAGNLIEFARDSGRQESRGVRTAKE